MYKRASFSIAAALLLSACSSGSGVTPVQNSSSSNVQSVSVQRSEASSGLSASQVIVSSGPFGGARVPLSTIVRQGAIRVLHAKGVPVKNMVYSEADLTWSPCSSGFESGTGVSNVTDYESGARTYYDAACTQLAEDVYVHLTNNTPGSTSAQNIAVAGTQLKQLQAGTVVSYDTMTGIITGTVSGSAPTLQATLQFSHAPNKTSQPTAQFGESCGISIGSTSQTCGMGNVAHVQSASADVGSTISLTTTNGTTTTVSGTLNTYAGALNSMTLAPGTFPAFAISGGQQIGTATLTGTEGLTSTFTIVDSKTDATVHISTTNSGGVTGTIVSTSTGATVATFTADMFGNGTITYSNGTTATITDWIVTG